MDNVIYYVFILIFIVFAIIANPIYERWRGRSWRDMAARRKLTYHSFDVGDSLLGYEVESQSSFSLFDRHEHGICQLGGSFNGVSVSARADVHGRGKQRHIRTLIEVSYPGEVPHDLLLTPEGLLAKLGKLAGGQDIRVGDAELDAAFVIRGALEEEVIPFLRSPRVRAGLLAIKRRYPQACFDRRGVRFEVRRFWSAEQNEEAFEFISGHMKHMAEGQTARALAADAGEGGW